MTTINEQNHSARLRARLMEHLTSARQHGLLAALVLTGLAVPVAAQTPPDCNSNAVGTSISPTINGNPIGPGQAVVPGQEIQYFVTVFVPTVPFIYCDVVGGQLSVTFPNWQAAPPLRSGCVSRLAHARTLRAPSRLPLLLSDTPLQKLR